MATKAPVPRIAMPNPHARKPSLSANVAQQDQFRNSSMDMPVPSIPLEHQRPSMVLGADIGQAVSSYSPIDGPSYKTSATMKYTPPPPPRKDGLSPYKSSDDSGYHSGGSASAKSPVVPFRSMFPTFDPSKTLQQQNYYPQRPIAAVANSIYRQSNRFDYPPSAITPIDRVLGPPSARTSVANFPLDPLPIGASSQRELAELWDATHGMEPNANIKSYDLELARTEEANFTLGSDPSTPFYSLITYDTNEIALSKTNPRKQAVKCEVSVNSIESPARRLPPQDGLVAFIFPKMAAMMAINQSSELAKEHNLAPTHRDEVQAAAVKRAADQEACRLKWNAHAQHYELEHPALGRRLRGPDFAKSPVSACSPQMGAPKTALDIHVSKSSAHSLPIITVPNPSVSDLESVSEPTIPGIRMSTIPQSERDGMLMSLDFNTRLLHVNANKILEYLPSLFAIDALVSALMTVAIADQTTNPVMASMELWEPKPTPIRLGSVYGGSQRAGSVYGGSVAGKSTAGSVFYATLAEREEAEAEAKELAAIHERDIKNEQRKKPQHSGWFGKKKQPKQKTKKVVMKEFDLEKLGHYQAGTRKGQSLPAPIRMLLSVMVGGLRFIVWILTTIVGFLSWLLVTCTRGVTSEKF